jgi:hypothetical protein
VYVENDWLLKKHEEAAGTNIEMISPSLLSRRARAAVDQPFRFTGGMKALLRKRVARLTDLVRHCIIIFIIITGRGSCTPAKPPHVDISQSWPKRGCRVFCGAV